MPGGGRGLGRARPSAILGTTGRSAEVSSIERLLGLLDQDAPVGQVVVGAFQTAVVLDTDPPLCGLASSLRTDPHHDHLHPPISLAGHLLDRSVKELAEGLRSPSQLEASIGMAAFNALLEVDEAACVEANAREVILEKGSGRSVAIVGHFPFIDRVRRQAQKCWVLELEPHPGDEPAARAAEILPQADVVAMSGTTLLNHSFDDLIQMCRPDAYVLLLGASAPLTALLFDYGVDAISGTRVIDVEGAVRAVGQGATFRQIPGKRLLTLTK